MSGTISWKSSLDRVRENFIANPVCRFVSGKELQQGREMVEQETSKGQRAPVHFAWSVDTTGPPH